MTRTEMNMLTERFAEVTGKQNDSVMNSARCAEYLGISQGALRKRVMMVLSHILKRANCCISLNKM